LLAKQKRLRKRYEEENPDEKTKKPDTSKTNNDPLTEVQKQDQESAAKEIKDKLEKAKSEGLTELKRTGDEKKDKENIEKVKSKIAEIHQFRDNKWANGGQNKHV